MFVIGSMIALTQKGKGNSAAFNRRSLIKRNVTGLPKLYLRQSHS